MKTLKTALLGICFLLAGFSTIAQNVTLTDVGKFKLRNSGNIEENGEIRGYYAFYKVERTSRKMNAYMLQVLNENLQSTVKTTIERSKYHYLIDVGYNGSVFFLYFYNYKERTYEITSMTRTGQEIGKYISPEVGKRDFSLNASYGYVNLGDGESNKSLFPVGNEGFMRLSLEFTKGNRYGYRLSYFSNSLEEQWTIAPQEGQKITELPIINHVDDRYAIVTLTRIPKPSSRDFKYFLQIVDLQDGTVTSELALSRSDYNHAILHAGFDANTGETFVMGNYFEPGDKTMKNKSMGVFSWVLDLNGTIKRKGYYDWGKDVARFLPVSDKGKLADGSYMFIHKAVKTADGKMYVIGEEFNKRVSALGVTANVLAIASGSSTSGMSNFEVVIRDMVIFEISPDLSLQAVKVFPKQQSITYLPAGFGLYGTTLMGYAMKWYNEFDYHYTQQISDEGVFYTTYFSRAKEKGKSSKQPIYGVLSVDDQGTYSKDQLKLRTENDYLRVYRAKPGYVAIWEYDRKEKTIQMRLEALNY